MFNHRHLISLEKFPKKDIQQIIDTAFNFKEVLERPIKKVPSITRKNDS